ncbi:hypothetical protein [Candidatus Magnetaquicoccus inordinatus]|uniref:hypothetical protein n=1 Tax=Candidatus Magnetaquicoccus inordinatus TaxID=2496818 RepID=UPI00102B8222|nr:hypothetical protein [Candidatus Magnetaquicoccus inordinatus]
MNAAYNSTLPVSTVADKFRRRVRAISWEILDEAVVFLFQAHRYAMRIKDSLCLMALRQEQLLAHR